MGLTEKEFSKSMSSYILEFVLENLICGSSHVLGIDLQNSDTNFFSEK
ncbi:hypothetical protein LEP1GSC082_3005 [Leptospira kirschneri str. H2]|nr:hypothetical protein LEP1GSC082_3005 [Leptospira kirschneri str. H2]